LALVKRNVPFVEAAQRVGLPFEVVEALAEMGLQAVPTLNPVPIPAPEPLTDAVRKQPEFPVRLPLPVQIPRQIPRQMPPIKL
ncbi:MAG: hypothetical protein HC835_22110, partial [Oscillatoriales cyanobacterium RM2_1_1]|nr:hypothetical protein [Oscillatoriales cyanobacterium RM2_1_1]